MKIISIILRIPVAFFGVVNLVGVGWYLGINNQIQLAFGLMIGVLEIVFCLLPEKAYSQKAKAMIGFALIFTCIAVTDIIVSIMSSGWMSLGTIAVRVIELIVFAVFVTFQLLASQTTQSDSEFTYSN